MTEPLTGRGWLARIDGTNMVLFLSGEWTARDDVSRMHVTDSLLQRSNIQALRFDSSNLGHWDSSLLVFLSSLREVSRRRRIVFDQTGLPPAARRLLALLPPAAPPESVVPLRNAGIAERVGMRAFGLWFDLIGITTLIGETILRTGATPVRGGNPSDDAVVAGMADAVNQLADGIASAVKGLPPLLGVSSPTIRAIERWQLPG